MNDIIKVISIGIGATAVMDFWLIFLKRLGVPTLNFAFIGRWVGHLLQGRVAHEAIARAQPIPGELALGWFTHYAIGIAFATLLVGLAGIDWATNPTLLPAVLVGMGTVAAPLLVMQPAMGAGFFASKTPTPLKNCLRSLANHSVFGLGLFLTAVLVDGIVR
ncbi:membrane protein [Metapseudomonas resinovorans]|uniref:DUF2938 domain-containing protein n=1 Tax=Metapseudomonas resinovorans TaxID=53412 RepID=UPI00098532D8|nr:DUF2938 domain-containing protein [Pseudomonas resinovorans]GLZ87603.1 membrane protein [Pseudomonas resinovorans]